MGLLIRMRRAGSDMAFRLMRDDSWRQYQNWPSLRSTGSTPRPIDFQKGIRFRPPNNMVMVMLVVSKSAN